MWSGGDDYSETGERVRIYQTAAKKKFTAGRQHEQKHRRRSSESFVGGGTTATAATCPVCQDPLYLLLQLFVPNFPIKDDISADENGSSRPADGDGNSKNNTVDRTLQVLACNRASCINGLFSKSSGSLNYGGGDGVIVCRRIMATDNDDAVTANTTTQEAHHPSSCGWDEADTSADATGSHKNAACDWNVDESSADDTLLALESQLANLETTPATTQQESKTRAGPSSRGSGCSKNDQYSFPCYELRSILEPPPPVQQQDGDDDDDVDICAGGGGDGDDKIQQMLARYMQEEEDEEILAALRGSNDASSSGGGGGEPDERLTPDDAALFTFKNRLQRAPQQVVRYCLGGIPMWSTPVVTTRPLQGTMKNNKQQAGVLHHDRSNVPKCACGASRVFEFQILPSLLHVLDVDRYVTASSTNNNDGAGPSLDERFENGAMNWGNVACYSCPKACSYADEFVVVQKSVDEQPGPPRRLCVDEPVFIQQDGESNDPDDVDDDDESA